jgi:hypothetical protein
MLNAEFRMKKAECRMEQRGAALPLNLAGDTMRAVAALLLSTVLAGPLAAQSPAERPAKPPRSLDQQLLDDLDRDLLQGLPTGKEAGKLSAPPNDDARRDREPEKATAKTAANPDHPLGKIASEMRQVERRMVEHDISSATQQQQAAIVAQLDALLNQAQQAQSGGQNKEGSGASQAGIGTGNPVPGPPRDSSNRIERGTKEEAETADVKDTIRRLWGHLPDKLRDEMQASLSEQFLPKYERLIEEYYKRLAEERP